MQDINRFRIANDFKEAHLEMLEAEKNQTSMLGWTMQIMHANIEKLNKRKFIPSLNQSPNELQEQ